MLQSIRKFFTTEDWVPARRVLQRDAEWWNKRRDDWAVRFGFMPQKELTGKRLRIGAHYLYQFGSGRFISHQLRDDEKERAVCQMIVAYAGQNLVYLALSRQLTDREINNLFSEDDRARLPDLSGASKLYVREHTPGIKDWVTMQYRRQIDGVRGQKTSPDGTRTFRYFLFVSEGNDRAIEIEWFDDGKYEVYATIYRPVSDIVQVQQERRATPRPPRSAGPVVVPPREQSAEILELTRPPRVEVAKEPAPEPPEESLVAEMPAEEPVTDVMPIEEHVALPAEAPEAYEDAAVAPYAEVPMFAEPTTVVPMPRTEPYAAPADESLTCNIRVASKIIEEALRNDMQLADIVRRVLGLPVAISETVSFQLPLTDRDYRQLAERYGIDASDHDAIRAYIVEDLIDFTGERDDDRRRKQ